MTSFDWHKTWVIKVLFISRLSKSKHTAGWFMFFYLSYDSKFTSLTEIQTNLHIVLVMDCKNPSFVVNCQSNPAFSKRCSVQWMDSWSKESMREVRKTLRELTTWCIHSSPI